jgi:molybdate transport system substrate-binding protein
MRALIFLVCCVFSAASVAQATVPAPEKLTVFAAASLKESLDTLAAQWQAQSGQEVVVVYAGSSALARQIEQGAPAQVFISADQAWMDYLQERALIAADSRFELVRNRLVLIANAQNAMPAMTLESALPGMLGDDGRLALANVDAVPAGKYAKQALIAIDRWDGVADRLAQADDVRAAMAFVARGEAPLGIVYATDAKAEPEVRVIAEIPESAHSAIVYPVARIAGNQDRLIDCFLGYLASPAAGEEFKRAGFVVLAPGADRESASSEMRTLWGSNYPVTCSFKGLEPAASPTH